MSINNGLFKDVSHKESALCVWMIFDKAFWELQFFISSLEGLEFAISAADWGWFVK